VLVECNADTCLVLTAAHVVANSTFIQVQLAGQPEKQTAHVVAVAHETDLATVAVPAAFFAGVAPLPLAPADALPALRDKVFVLGYLVGGDDLSITEGVVSRIEVQSYSHSHARALAVTVDAAVNSGNSGGPVVSEATGEVVGIAFQGYAGSDVEGQGHMVPPPLVGRFLAAARAGRPTGLPSLGVYLQLLQSPALRRQLRMADSMTGVLVTWVEHGSCCEGVLRIGDVLMDVAGVRVQRRHLPAAGPPPGARSRAAQLGVRRHAAAAHPARWRAHDAARHPQALRRPGASRPVRRQTSVLHLRWLALPAAQPRVPLHLVGRQGRAAPPAAAVLYVPAQRISCLACVLTCAPDPFCR
jgi:hypothetical protein